VRRHKPETADVISGGSFGFTLVGDVMQGSERVLQDVSFTEWSFTGDLDANVKTSGQVTLVIQDDFARSFSPRRVQDALAPFGGTVRVYALVTLGAYEDRIPIGTFRITDVPQSMDESINVAGRSLTVGSQVTLTLMDKFYEVDVPFMRLENPASLTSAWSELIRIARLAGTRTVDDVAIPRSVVYARNRLDAVQQLAGVLGGRAYMRSDGTVGIVPDELGDVDVTLNFGQVDGKIIDVAHFMSSADIFNAVFGDFEDVNGRPIHAEDWIRTGPLAVDGPLGERPIEYPADQREFIKTQAAADTAVSNYLAKVSKGSPLEVPVTLTVDPRLEFDVVTVNRPGPDGEPDPARSFTGRICRWQMSKGQAMQATVRVPNA
jgi:hypothetical protein